MAETVELQNDLYEGGTPEPEEMMAGAKPTTPTPTDAEQTAAVTTYAKRLICDTETGRELEYVQYEYIKELLEKTLAEEEKVEEVSVDERFFRYFGIHIDRKDRDITVQLKLLSERDTRYENFHGKSEMQYTFASSYEDSNSLALMTESGSSITIGCNVAAKAASGNVGYQHSWKNRETAGEAHAERRDMTLTGVVAPGECVTVKETVHSVKKTAVYDVELKIPENAKVHFTGTKKHWYGTRTKLRTTRMKKLLTDEFRNDKCIRVWRGKVDFHLRNRFVNEAIEHTLEVLAHKSEERRAEQVKLVYEKGCHNHANVMAENEDYPQTSN